MTFWPLLPTHMGQSNHRSGTRSLEPLTCRSKETASSVTRQAGTVDTPGSPSGVSLAPEWAGPEPTMCALANPKEVCIG
jgi:hypothetical protein